MDTNGNIGEVVTEGPTTAIGEAIKGAAKDSAARSAKAATVKGNPLTEQFKLTSFQLPNKSASFKNDDGTITERLAYAHLKLIPSGMPFRASVYLAKRIDGTEEVYLAMPSSGKGFPQPVFNPDTPALQSHYDSWRYDMALAYEKWAATLTTAPIASTAARLVRKASAPTK
jgi:hypothetical protein